MNYYSILFDGANSDECNADGISEAMKNSFNELNFNFEPKNKEIRMCSNGAAVNRAVLINVLSFPQV